MLFTANSAELGDTDRDTLHKQAAWLKRYPPHRMAVEGYADEPGPASANLDLGKRRAAAVVAYLERHGVRGVPPPRHQLRELTPHERRRAFALASGQEK